MLKNLLLTLIAVVSLAGTTAKAQEFGKPIAYLSNDNGGLLVLTDKEDRTRCPPKSFLAVATNKREDTKVMQGCWVAMRNQKTNKIEIMIAWLPEYNVQWIPLEKFRSPEVEGEGCAPSLYL